MAEQKNGDKPTAQQIENYRTACRRLQYQIINKVAVPCDTHGGCCAGSDKTAEYVAYAYNHKIKNLCHTCIGGWVPDGKHPRPLHHCDEPVVITATGAYWNSGDEATYDPPSPQPISASELKKYYDVATSLRTQRQRGPSIGACSDQRPDEGPRHGPVAGVAFNSKREIVKLCASCMSTYWGSEGQCEDLPVGWPWPRYLEGVGESTIKEAPKPAKGFVYNEAAYRAKLTQLSMNPGSLIGSRCCGGTAYHHGIGSCTGTIEYLGVFATTGNFYYLCRDHANMWWASGKPDKAPYPTKIKGYNGTLHYFSTPNNPIKHAPWKSDAEIVRPAEVDQKETAAHDGIHIAYGEQKMPSPELKMTLGDGTTYSILNDSYINDFWISESDHIQYAIKNPTKESAMTTQLNVFRAVVTKRKNGKLVKEFPPFNAESTEQATLLVAAQLGADGIDVTKVNVIIRTY